jgi:sterol desaturase/sphingolipid hydroxylase (fatty acid hydroxylase superfamily)
MRGHWKEKEYCGNRDGKTHSPVNRLGRLLGNGDGDPGLLSASSVSSSSPAAEVKYLLSLTGNLAYTDFEWGRLTSRMGGRLESFLGKALFDFMFSPTVFFKLVFLLRLVVFTTLEFLRPARSLSYLSVIGRDLIAYVVFRCAILPVCIYLNDIFPGYHPAPASVAHLPLAVRVILYFILADFGHYWIHRLTHTRYLWRVHKWHHAPTYMYWLGGVRTTIPDFFMVNIPYVLAYSVLYISPWWMASAIAVSSILQNDWMHMNVTWRSRWLEWVIVTPRYHHIHHSDDPEHYGRNMASLFTVWDRLFGTYLDPEKVDAKLSFGIGEKENPARLVLGV